MGEIARTYFAGQHESLRARRAVVRSDDGLQERELHKLSVLTGAVEAGFRERGLDEVSAAVAARVATSVLDVSLDRWLDGDGEQPLVDLVRESTGALVALVRAP